MQESTEKPNPQGTFRLFQVAGIHVFLHWSWLVVAVYELQQHKDRFRSPIWSVLEYLCLFGIVLLHEFGHALACRSVGGTADTIVLWPLGGIAFVSPPQRPGAVLWSIAAGPLVNAVLAPILIGACFYANSHGLRETNPDANHFLLSLAYINVALLVFNMLPIYPLDGGQILQALLWFVIGRTKSLMVASFIGLIGAVAVIGFALYSQSLWLGVIAIYAASQAWNGFKRSRIFHAWESLPRRADVACPECDAHPIRGDAWICAGCGTAFDVFNYHAVCPNCGSRISEIPCMDCGKTSPLNGWRSSPSLQS